LTTARVNEHTGQLLLVGPNAQWPTLPKFWADHGRVPTLQRPMMWEY